MQLGLPLSQGYSGAARKHLQHPREQSKLHEWQAPPPCGEPVAFISPQGAPDSRRGTEQRNRRHHHAGDTRWERRPSDRGHPQRRPADRVNRGQPTPSRPVRCICSWSPRKEYPHDHCSLRRERQYRSRRPFRLVPATAAIPATIACPPTEGRPWSRARPSSGRPHLPKRRPGLLRAKPERSVPLRCA